MNIINLFYGKEVKNMKNMKKIVSIVSGFGLLISSVMPVMATLGGQPLNNDSTTVVLQKIKPGTLTIQAPADILLPDVYVSSQVEPVDVTAEDFLVDDSRGTKAPAGWSFTVTMGKLASSTEGTDIPFIDTVASHNDYKITPLALVQYNGASLTGVTLGSSTELTEVGTTGISAPKTVVTAAATSGKGRFGCDVKLDLNVPANSTAADDYTSTMTFTVV